MPSAKLVGKERHVHALVLGMSMYTMCIYARLYIELLQREHEREGQRGLKRAFCT